MVDFQGIIRLNWKIVEHLKAFLKEKESRLASQILLLIPPLENEPELVNNIKLSEAIDTFIKKGRNQHVINASPNKEYAVKKMNTLFWEFTEVLESCSVELFLQTKQISIDQWDSQISDVVKATKDILIHYIEDTLWIIRRLEKPLRDYCQLSNQEGKLKKWLSFTSSYIDKTLLTNLIQTEKFLKNEYLNFKEKYYEFNQLNNRLEALIDRIRLLPIFSILDLPEQNLYIEIYRLLKMLELNSNTRKEITVETKRAIKRVANEETVIKLFRKYYKEIKQSLFKNSLEWKNFNKEEENYRKATDRLKEKTSQIQDELNLFLETISHYRLFILRSNSNPYVRTRWGFSEWIVGPEPIKSKKLTHLIFSINELQSFYKRFAQSISNETLSKKDETLRDEIYKILHEMGLPLISQSMMRKRAKKLLDHLVEYNEIGCDQMSIINDFEEILSKAMRQDWKYHILHEFSQFHQMYDLHFGLSEHFDDPLHVFRLDRFSLLFKQIKHWVDSEDIDNHVEQLELDRGDIKGYLQDFLASAQRTVKEKSQNPFLEDTIHRFKQQLLEYRYIFGEFCFSILEKKEDASQLRDQFLFVDQYFETVENLLDLLRN